MAKAKIIVFNIIAVISITIGITASFLHKTQPSTDFRQEELNNKRALLKEEWNNKELMLDQKLLAKKISISDYLYIKSKNENDRVLSFQEISKERKSLAIDFSFNGRSSLHYWLWVFGMCLTTFIISCYLANKDSRLKKSGDLKWYEPFASISFIAISLFWLYHTIFMVNIDFKLTTYILYLVLIIIPLSYFLYHFIRRSIFIEVRLLENIKLLVSHVLNNTKEEKEEEKWELLDKVSKNGK